MYCTRGALGKLGSEPLFNRPREFNQFYRGVGPRKSGGDALCQTPRAGSVRFVSENSSSQQAAEGIA